MAEIGGFNKDHPLYREDLENILSIPGAEKLKGKSFLITGASGLIGVCLVDALMRFNRQGADITVYAVGRSREKAAARLGEYYRDSHFHFIEQDVRQPLPADIVPDFIIPLASNTHPLAYSQFPVETIEINVRGAEHALQKAVETHATVLYPSTVEIYGNARGADVFSEGYTGQLDLSTARACYPESKRVSEALCQSYVAERNVCVKIARLCRVFGPTMLESDSKASSQFIRKALCHEDIVLKSEGKQVFSYLYVADAVAGLLTVLLHGEPGVPYNISSELTDVMLRDFARLCAEECGKSVVFEQASDTERKGYSVATKAIMANDRILGIGFRPKYTMKDAVHRTIAILNR